jgi:hypothetical protein
MAQRKSQYKQEQRKKSLSGIINNFNCVIKIINITLDRGNHCFIKVPLTPVSLSILNETYYVSKTFCEEKI